MFANDSNSGIFKSVDAGINWIKVTSNPFGLDVEFKPRDLNTIYATGNTDKILR